jgi:hypothetical protein
VRRRTRQAHNCLETRQRVGRAAGRAERLERSETFGSKGFGSILSRSRSMQYRSFLSVSRAIGAGRYHAHPTQHCLEDGMTCARRTSSLPRPTTSNAETQFIARCASDALQRSDSGSTAPFVTQDHGAARRKLNSAFDTLALLYSVVVMRSMIIGS